VNVYSDNYVRDSDNYSTIISMLLQYEIITSNTLVTEL